MSIWVSSSYLPYLFREKYNYLHDLIWLYSHHSYKCICIPWFFLVNFERNTNIPRRKNKQRKKNTWLDYSNNFCYCSSLLFFRMSIHLFCIVSYLCDIYATMSLWKKIRLCGSLQKKKHRRFFLYEDDDDDRVCVHFPTWNFYHFLRTYLLYQDIPHFVFTVWLWLNLCFQFGRYKSTPKK